MIKRTDLLEHLASRITNEIVVATYSSASDWIEIADRPLNYFSFGAMGLASSHALGLALARPERRVVVLDGDGSLLMNLGSLVTIAKVAPVNLTHFVFKNGSYEANGGHPIPNAGVDFAGIARSSGIAKTWTIRDLDDFKQRTDFFLTEPGPLFASIEIEQGPLGPRDYSYMYRPEQRQALRDALAGK